ncbi:MAG: acetate--CoA ligase family protein [Acidimicrobiia bacterium]|nr:acetate--CoA ligase family protein [Acidimicrobiia bacterium]
MPDLSRLIAPRSIAMVGGRQAELAIEQCDALGYEGEVWAVHPTRNTIGGRKAYRSIHELPAVPDAAFVAVNRLDTVEVVQALAKVGAGGAVCYAAGFAEAGADGIELQQRLVAHDMPVIGPNCYGVINATTGAALWPDVQGCRRATSGAALVTQSGNIALNLTMNRRGLNFTHVVSLGNQAGVRIEDCITYFAHDPATSAIGVHAESIVDTQSFAAAALAARAAKTPIVMLKTGRSETAAMIATSHTAAIAKPDSIYGALFDRYGVITVDSISQLAATLDFLVTVGPLRSNRVISLSCSGGEASLVADRAENNGVVFEPFAAEQSERIGDVLTDRVAITNPLDYHTFIWDHEPELTECFTAALDGAADAAMLVLDWPNAASKDASWWPTLRAIAAARATTGTPTVVSASIADNMPDAVCDEIRRLGMVAGYSIDETLSAMGAAARVGSSYESATPTMHLPSSPATGSNAILTEHAAKVLLQRAGCDVPESVVLGPQHPMPDVAFPVVVKAVGLLHKSDHGGVIVNVANQTALASAVERVRLLSDAALVERQVTDVVAELLVTARREHPIGVTLTLGAGGELVELIDSTATALLPVDDAGVMELLDRVSIGRILSGIRGRAPANVAAVIECIQAISSLLIDRPDIVEIEVNPLLATTTSAVVVDALITLEEAPQ